MSDHQQAGTAKTKARMGRPPATSLRQLENVALELFAKQGYTQTTVEEIAAAAGVTKRTFFRYFGSKTELVWREFDAEVELIRDELTKTPARLSVMTAIRQAVISASKYPVDDVPRLRARMTLTATEPELMGRMAVHQEAWAREVADFVAARTGLPASSMFPVAVGRAVLGTCRAAYDRWASQDVHPYTTFLDVLLRALAAGFPDRAFTEEP